MDFKFSKDSDSEEASSAPKGRQNALLVLLLILVGGFAYLYFFTGLIRPQQQNKPSPAPAPQVVKMPLPPHGGEGSKAETAPAQTDKKAAATASPAVPEHPKAAQAPSVPAPAVTQPAKQKEPAVKAEAAKPAEKKPLPVPAAPKSQKAAAPDAVAAKKPAVAAKQAPAETRVAAVVPGDSKGAAVRKPVPKPKSPATVAAKAVTPTANGTSGQQKAAGGGEGTHWTVVVGTYLLEDALGADLIKVRKAGFEAAVQPGGRKKTSMHRLLLARYDDRASAQASLDRLQRHTADGFVIDEGGTYAVYAGSYLLDSRASMEKDRLAAAGFVLTLKRAEVAIPARRLVAGSFADRKRAEAVRKQLNDAGLKATLVRQ